MYKIIRESKSIETDQNGTGENVKKSSEERTADLNREIEKKCEQYTEEAKQRAEEYHQAFLETGGTEEEWKEHDICLETSMWNS